MPETDRLFKAITNWWPAIEVLIVTGVSNARTEAVNNTIKHLERTGRGYRYPAHYRARILLASAARTIAWTPDISDRHHAQLRIALNVVNAH